MIDGIYVAASGGFKQEKSLEVISNNLANVNTVGYKRDTLAFKEFLAPFPDGTENEPSVSKPGEHNLRKDDMPPVFVPLLELVPFHYSFI